MAAAEAGVIGPVDTSLVSQLWLGALNEIILRWLLQDKPAPLMENAIAVRELLMSGIGVQAGYGEAARRAGKTSGRGGGMSPNSRTSTLGPSTLPRAEDGPALVSRSRLLRQKVGPAEIYRNAEPGEELRMFWAQRDRKLVLVGLGWHVG